MRQMNLVLEVLSLIVWRSLKGQVNVCFGHLGGRGTGVATTRSGQSFQSRREWEAKGLVKESPRALARLKEAAGNRSSWRQRTTTGWRGWNLLQELKERGACKVRTCRAGED